MKAFLLVFLGGGAGSVLRYYFGKIGNGLWAFFPAGTFAANLLSCLVLGFFAVILTQNEENDSLKKLILVGFCGGFSTFSTFTNELAGLLKGENIWPAAAYAGLSLILGLGGLAAGAALAKMYLKP